MDQEKNELLSGNELGDVGSESSSYSEFDQTVNPAVSVPESRVEREFSLEDQPPQKKKEDKKAVFFHKILVTATVAVAAAITAETVGIIGFPDLAVREAYVETSESAVWYSMELEGYAEGGDELAAEVYNDFERFREPLSIEEEYEEERNPNEQRGRFAYGEVYNLRPDTEYTLEIFYGNWTVYKQKIRTAKQEEPWQEEPHEDPDTGDPEPVQASLNLESSASAVFYSGEITNFQPDDVFVVRLSQNGDSIRQNQVVGLSVEEPYFSGEFDDLEPDAGYSVQLIRNPDTNSEQLVAEQSVSTQPVEAYEPTVEAEWEEVEASESDIAYSVYLTNYQEGEPFTVQLLNKNEVISQSTFDDISVDEPFLSGTFSGLEAGTEYTLQLLQEDIVISEYSIFTQSPEEAFEPEFSATENSIFYSIPLTDYTEGDWYLVTLAQGADQIESNQVVDISPAEPFANGEFTDLQPATEYTIQLLKNQEPVSEWTVYTQQADGQDPTTGG